MAVAMIGPKFYAWDRNGKPLAFGKLYTYQARTNTPKPTYQSEDQVVENTNPVILNGEGYANVYLDGSYKMVLKDDKDNEIWSSDPVTANQAEEWTNCLPAEYVSPTAFKVAGNFTEEYETGRSVRLNDGGTSYIYSTISDSSYAAGFTTVTVISPVVTVPLQDVCVSILSLNSFSKFIDLIYARTFDTISEAAAYDSAIDDSVFIVSGFNTPDDGGGGIYDVVQTSSVIPNGKNVIQMTSTANLSLVLRRETLTATFEEREYYVDPVDGSDIWGYGFDIGDKAFKTIQFAFDQLPNIIAHQQTINISGGEFDKSSRPPSEMPRPAIFYPQGKYIGRRTAQDGSDLEGMVVIKGQGKANSIIRTDPLSGYAHGVYVSGTEIAMQELGVKPGAGATTSSLVVSHRGAYIHGRDLDIGGAGASLGLVNEAGGWSEMISCTIKDSDGQDVVVYQTSACSLAGDNSDIGDILCTGFVQLAQSVEVNGDILISTGGEMQFTSSSASFPTVINGTVEAINAQVGGAFCELLGNITGRGSDFRLSACGWQESFTMFGGTVRLDGSKSYVSPNTQSNVVSPLVLRDGARRIPESTTEIKNSNGDLVGEEYGNQVISVNANGFDIPATQQGMITTSRVVGSGASRTGCTIGDLQNVFPGSEPGDGLILMLVGGGFNVEIVDGTTASIPGGSVTIGGLSGAYSGATFVYSTNNNKWNLQAVGSLIP